MVKEISHTMDHFGGLVKEKKLWPLPGFCIPLERLAFEAIPQLGVKFTEPVEGANPECPRMCRSKFKKTEMKGFPLSSVNQELDKIKPREIDSIVPTLNDEEKALLADVWEEDDDDEKPDIAVDSWIQRINEGYTVFFKDMYEEDMEDWKATAAAQAVLEDVAPVEEVAEQKKMLEDLVKLVKSLGNKLETVLERQNVIEERLATVEGKKKGKKGSKKN